MHYDNPTGTFVNENALHFTREFSQSFAIFDRSFWLKSGIFIALKRKLGYEKEHLGSHLIPGTN